MVLRMHSLYFALGAIITSLAPVRAAPAWTDGAPYKRDPIDPDDFVKVNGLRLYDKSGPIYLTGMNYWSCMSLAAGESVGGSYQRLRAELDQMAAKGINHLRIMASAEGAKTPQPFRINPPLMESPGKYNEQVFKGLDICLDEMAKRGMRATMTLNNNWVWSGGFAQYVSWANDDEQIPYHPSWNLSAPPQRATPRTGWGNYTIPDVDPNTVTWGNYSNYRGRFYRSEKAQEWYRNHINTVANRVSTVNGRTYKEDATIMSWNLANEPGGELNWYEDDDVLEKDAYFPWVKDTSEYIKSVAPKQLVSNGGVTTTLDGDRGEIYYKAAQNISTIDYTTTHIWAQNAGIYNMTNSSRANYDVAVDWALEIISNTSKWSKDLGKPCFLEEFGMARNNWENLDKEYIYLSSASTSNKDAYFTALLGRVLDDFKYNEGAYIGTAPWAYGGIYRPETQYINDYGMVWASDPPHESPGWYDCYDDDEAMNVIHRQQQDADSYIKSHMQS